MSGLSPPTFATLFRQLLQRDAALVATRGGRGRGEDVTTMTAMQYHPAPMAIDARKHMDCRLPFSSKLPRVLLDFQLISIQSLSGFPGLHFVMPIPSLTNDAMQASPALHYSEHMSAVSESAVRNPLSPTQRHPQTPKASLPPWFTEESRRPLASCCRLRRDRVPPGIEV